MSTIRAAAVVFALATLGALAVVLAGQRGPGTNVFVADAVVIANGEIVATTVSVEGELVGVDCWGAGGKESAELLAKWQNVSFRAEKARVGVNQVIFTGIAELHITARGKHKVFVDQGGWRHMPRFSVTYILKNGRKLRTNGLMAPARVTK